MGNPVHIAQIALLVAVAYFVGCLIGYGARRLKEGWQAMPADVQASGRIIAPAAVSLPAVAEPAAAIEELMPAPRPAERVPGLIRRADVEAVDEPPPIIAPVPGSENQPRGLAKPRGGIKDDLKQINGIGSKLESKLNDFGIFHITQIANWTPRQAIWISDQIGFKGRVEREQWVAQAKLISKTMAKTKEAAS